MGKDEALKQALEYVDLVPDDRYNAEHIDREALVAAIEEALAHDDEDAIIIQYHEATIKILEKRIEELTAQPEQEPVARVIDNGTPEGATEWIPFTNRVEPLKTGDLLYTTPPQRPWVGLTDEEILQGNKESWVTLQAWQSAVWWAEAKLREKNA